ncbi:myosin-6-like isoform X2 [Engraulis encrasicolus]|uniref:myosin-6-like isoform X2 n=1 Tax=Engraulis encrasicolus TaxID=184585 RepID=UPI002FD34A98
MAVLSQGQSCPPSRQDTLPRSSLDMASCSSTNTEMERSVELEKKEQKELGNGLNNKQEHELEEIKQKLMAVEKEVATLKKALMEVAKGLEQQKKNEKQDLKVQEEDMHKLQTEQMMHEKLMEHKTNLTEQEKKLNEEKELELKECEPKQPTKQETETNVTREKLVEQKTHSKELKEKEREFMGEEKQLVENGREPRVQGKGHINEENEMLEEEQEWEGNIEEDTERQEIEQDRTSENEGESEMASESNTDTVVPTVKAEQRERLEWLIGELEKCEQWQDMQTRFMDILKLKMYMLLHKLDGNDGNAEEIERMEEDMSEKMAEMERLRKDTMQRAQGQNTENIAGPRIAVQIGHETQRETPEMDVERDESECLRAVTDQNGQHSEETSEEINSASAEKRIEAMTDMLQLSDCAVEEQQRKKDTIKPQGQGIGTDNITPLTMCIQKDNKKQPEAASEVKVDRYDEPGPSDVEVDRYEEPEVGLLGGETEHSAQGCGEKTGELDCTTTKMRGEAVTERTRVAEQTLVQQQRKIWVLEQVTAELTSKCTVMEIERAKQDLRISQLESLAAQMMNTIAEMENRDEAEQSREEKGNAEKLDRITEDADVHVRQDNEKPAILASSEKVTALGEGMCGRNDLEKTKWTCLDGDVLEFFRQREEERHRRENGYKKPRMSLDREMTLHREARRRERDAKMKAAEKTKTHNETMMMTREPTSWNNWSDSEDTEFLKKRDLLRALREMDASRTKEDENEREMTTAHCSNAIHAESEGGLRSLKTEEEKMRKKMQMARRRENYRNFMRETTKNTLLNLEILRRRELDSRAMATARSGNFRPHEHLMDNNNAERVGHSCTGSAQSCRSKANHLYTGMVGTGHSGYGGAGSYMHKENQGPRIAVQIGHETQRETPEMNVERDESECLRAVTDQNGQHSEETSEKINSASAERRVEAVTYIQVSDCAVEEHQRNEETMLKPQGQGIGTDNITPSRMCIQKDNKKQPEAASDVEVNRYDEPGPSDVEVDRYEEPEVGLLGGETEHSAQGCGEKTGELDCTTTKMRGEAVKERPRVAEQTLDQQQRKIWVLERVTAELTSKCTVMEIERAKQDLRISQLESLAAQMMNTIAEMENRDEAEQSREEKGNEEKMDRTTEDADVHVRQDNEKTAILASSEKVTALTEEMCERNDIEKTKWSCLDGDDLEFVHQRQEERHRRENGYKKSLMSLDRKITVHREARRRERDAMEAAEKTKTHNETMMMTHEPTSWNNWSDSEDTEFLKKRDLLRAQREMDASRTKEDEHEREMTTAHCSNAIRTESKGGLMSLKTEEEKMRKKMQMARRRENYRNFMRETTKNTLLNLEILRLREMDSRAMATARSGNFRPHEHLMDNNRERGGPSCTVSTRKCRSKAKHLYTGMEGAGHSAYGGAGSYMHKENHRYTGMERAGHSAYENAGSYMHKENQAYTGMERAGHSAYGSVGHSRPRGYVDMATATEGERHSDPQPDGSQGQKQTKRGNSVLRWLKKRLKNQRGQKRERDDNSSLQ